ncbi:cell wall-binding repeat-containing protein [Leifsonia sp. fls2-241-R2A-40a]|uniref:cell wall-binding repeat-containing protein n=1 Tax=Leifsonia sp. fls2-241-R2A-40a TaxID=3040290 RepID=UPI002549E89D|nr:cell wall-binding repeat-containing protein [Leifsonia sp. fls2-241-R2A-40a]
MRSSTRVTIAIVTAVAATTLTAGAVAPAVAGTPTGSTANLAEYATAPGSTPNGLRLEPDGNMWFGEADGIGRIGHDGKVTEFPLPATFQGMSLRGTYPNPIVPDSSGNLWFGGGVDGSIGYIGEYAAGGITIRARTTGPVTDLQIGPNGHFYYSTPLDTIIREVTPDFATTIAHPTGLTSWRGYYGWKVTGDGDIYDFSLGKLNRIDATSGVSARVPLPGGDAYSPGANKTSLNADTAGNLWTALKGAIVKIAVNGTVTTIPTPTGLNGSPAIGGAVHEVASVVADDDGVVWLEAADIANNNIPDQVWRMNSPSDIHPVSDSYARSDDIINAFVAGADGSLWVDRGRLGTDAQGYDTLTSQWIERFGYMEDPHRYTLPGQPDAFVSAIAVDTAGQAWFADSQHDAVGVVQAVDTWRISGDDRYSTNMGVLQSSGLLYPDTAFIATGENFADALAAAPAAAANNAPLLLVGRNYVPPTLEQKLIDDHVTKLRIIGGPSAVSPAVVDRIAHDTGITDVQRYYGSDRFSTSLIVAAKAFPSSTKAFIATGMNFPDALSAGAPAGKLKAPIILVNGAAGSLDSATAAELTKLGVTKTYLAGGTSVVSSGLQSSLASHGFAPTRFAGSDRYQTSSLITRAFYTPGSHVGVYLASGVNFPDALSGAAAAGYNGSALELVQPTCVPRSVSNDLYSIGATNVDILGGPNALAYTVGTLDGC